MTEASSKARLGGCAPVLALVSTKTTFMDFFGGGESTYCYNIPLEVNYLPVEKKSKVDAFAYLNIGYRHVANNDFVFCAGVTPHSSFSPTRATTEAK